MRSKNSFKIIFAVFFVTLLPITVAAGFKASKWVRLGSSDSVGGDYLQFAESVNVAGKISGDLMVGAATLDISGEIGGDMLIAGGFVNTSGKAAGSLRALGAKLDFSGEVGRNLTALAADIRLDRNLKVTGRTYLAGENILVKSINSGSLVAAGRSVELDGAVSGSVTVYAESLVVGENADIQGDLVYYSNQPADIHSGAEIGGEVARRSFQDLPFAKKAPADVSSRLFFALWKLAAFLLIALLAWRLFRARIERLLSGVHAQAWKNLLWGILGFLAVPAAVFIAAMTIIGLPLAFILSVLYVISLLLAGVMAFLLFGRALFQLFNLKETSGDFPWQTYLLGGLALTAIGFVPVLGPPMVFIVWLWSLGALYRNLANKGSSEQS